MSDPRELSTLRVPVPAATLRYGTHEQQTADVWLPDADPVAVVLFLHGGFWRDAIDRRYTAPCTHALARSGYAAANVEYRRVGGEGGIPATFDDIASASDELPRMVRSACELPETTPVLLAGHSAGGHLALWAAVRHLLPASSRWRRPEPVSAHGILALAAVASVADALAEGIGENAAAELLGDTEYLDEIDPARIGASATRTSLVHGKRDHRVPFDYSVAYRRMLGEAGTAARLDAVADAGHFEIVDPRSDAWTTVLDSLNWLGGRRR